MTAISASTSIMPGVSTSSLLLNQLKADWDDTIIIRNNQDSPHGNGRDTHGEGNHDDDCVLSLEKRHLSSSFTTTTTGSSSSSSSSSSSPNNDDEHPPPPHKQRHTMESFRSVKECLRSKTIPHPTVRRLLLRLCQQQQQQQQHQQQQEQQEPHCCEHEAIAGHGGDDVVSMQLQQGCHELDRVILPALCKPSSTLYNHQQQADENFLHPYPQNHHHHLHHHHYYYHLMSHCALVIHFLQLLLEQPSPLIPVTITAAQACATDGKQRENMEWNQYVQGLLLTFTKALTALALPDRNPQSPTMPGNDNNHHTEQTPIMNQTLDVEQIYQGTIQSAEYAALLYSLGGLIRLNHYVAVHPTLLAPLWKGICTMANHLQRLPTELVQWATKAILQHMRDGIHSMQQSTWPSLQTVLTLSTDASTRQQVLLQQTVTQGLVEAKIVGFLLARLCTILRAGMVPADTAQQLLLPILSLLRGIGESLRYHTSETSGTTTTSLIQAYDQMIATRAKQAFEVWYHCFHPTRQPSSWSNHSQPQTPPNDCDTEHAIGIMVGAVVPKEVDVSSSSANAGIAKGAYAYGRVIMLLHIMENPCNEENSTAISPNTIEPVLHASEELLFQLLPQCYCFNNDLVTRSLSILSSVFIRCEMACRHRHLLHAYWVQWLAIGSATAPQHPLTRQLIKYLITLHAMSLHRIGGEPTAAPFLELLVQLVWDPRTKRTLREGIAACLVKILHIPKLCEVLRKPLIRARNQYWCSLSRSSSTSEKCTAASTNTPTRRRLELQDIAIIGMVLSSAPKAFYGSNPNGEVGNCLSTKRLATEILLGNERGSLSTLIDVFLEHCIKRKNDENPRTEARRLLMFRSILHCAWMLSRWRHSLSETDLASIHRLYIHGIRSYAFLERTEAALIDWIRLLGVLGTATTATTPQDNLLGIAQSFHSLLSSGDFSIRTSAMNAFISFALTVSANHKDILPKCVPTQLQPFVQFRLQSKVPDKAHVETVLWHKYRDRLACTSMSTTQPNLQLTPPGNFVLEKGSLIMSMPTQEGRRALVIFPPGEDSLRDIEALLGAQSSRDEPDENTDPTVQRFHYAVPRKNGSYMLVVHPINER